MGKEIKNDLSEEKVDTEVKIEPKVEEKEKKSTKKTTTNTKNNKATTSKTKSSAKNEATKKKAEPKPKKASKSSLNLDDVEIIEKKEKEKSTKEKNKTFKEQQEHLKKIVETKKQKKHDEIMEEMIAKRRNSVKTLSVIGLILLIVLIFSTVFALINFGNENILKNVIVEDIDISKLTKERAIEKISLLYNEKANEAIIFELGEYSRTITPNEIDFDVNSEKTVENAYNLGRTNNIFKNNYTILFSYFKRNNIDIEYSYDRQLMNQVLKDISVKIPGKTLENTHSIKNDELIIIKGSDGIDIIEEEMIKTIVSSFIHLKNGETIEIPVKETQPEPISLSKISKEITVEAKDAEYDEKTKIITPEINGVEFKDSISEAQKILAEDKEKYIIPLKITIPKVTTDSIKDKYNLYKYDDILAEETTYYDATYYTRSVNMEVATKQISGTVIKPGQEFSFNSFVGATSAEDGYLSAIGYAGGKAVPMMGGGVCQISSEIYSAALKVDGIKITERFNHVCPVGYLPPGQDATTDLGSCDLRFINNRKEPIKIILKTGNGVSKIEIRGVKEANEPVIKLTSTVINTVPFRTNYVQDNSLKKGREVIDTKGITGYTSKLYKETYVNGVLINKKLVSTDTYQPLHQVIRRNK